MLVLKDAEDSRYGPVRGLSVSEVLVPACCTFFAWVRKVKACGENHATSSKLLNGFLLNYQYLFEQLARVASKMFNERNYSILINIKIVLIMLSAGLFLSEIHGS
jgi:hypothetical protein